MIYLDHNSTTRPLASVLEGIEGLKSMPLNASSLHYYGRIAKTYIENARKSILSILDANTKYNLLFTSSATEANNQIINHFAKNGRILISAIEHESIRRYVDHIQNIDMLAVDQDGIVRLDHLEKWLQTNQHSGLVSIIFANSETGVIQPLEYISKLVHQYSCTIHSDFVQAFGKMNINLKSLNPDIITISSHKIGGIHGSGAIIYKTSHKLTPLIIGGGQEFGFRSGTENVQAIHAFAIAANHNAQYYDIVKIKKLRDSFENMIKNITDEALFISDNVLRTSNTSMVYMPFVESATQLIKFDMENIYVSAGSACFSRKNGIPYTLRAMKIDDKIAKCCIRFSFGQDTTQDQIEKTVNIWKKIFYKQ